MSASAGRCGSRWWAAAPPPGSAACIRPPPSIQSGLATKLEDGPQNRRLRWLLDPQRSGLALVMSAIGCHAQHLACFTAGRNATRVCADVRSLLPGRKVIDYVSALFELEGGARGTFTVTQAAAGGENDIRLRVYAEKGMLDW